MIWVRRFLAVILIVLVVPISLAALLVLRVNGTILSADFYVKELRKADIFNFLYDEAVPAAMEEVKKSQTLPVDISVFQATALTSVKEVLPPEWLEEQAENTIEQVVPYLVGDTDSFAITVSVKERIESLGDVLKRELGGGDTYNLLFDEVMTPMLKEELGDVVKLPMGLSVASQDIVASVKKVVPPEWAKARVEHVVDQAVPYLTGKSEHFAIKMPVADRLEALSPEVKALLAKSGVYTILSRPEFSTEVDKALKDFGALPFGVKLTAGQIVPAAQTVAPPEWLQARTESILDAMVPYVAGRKQGFEVVIPLKDRVQAAGPAVKKLLRDVDAYNLLFDQVVATLVKGSVGDKVELPFGIAITQGEVVSAMRDALPPAFVQEQAEKMIDTLVPYLTGEAQTFKIVVPLAERKEAAVRAAEALVDRKLQERFNGLPGCTLRQALDLVQRGLGGAVPSCKPVGYSLDEIKRELGIQVPGVTAEDLGKLLNVDITLLTEPLTLDKLKKVAGFDVAAQVRQVVASIPDEFSYTDAKLRETLGADHEATLDKVLAWIRDGYKYTDADLRKTLNAEQEKILDQALKLGREGLNYTDADLRKALGPAEQEILDQVLKVTREGFTFTDADLRKLLSDQGFASAGGLSKESQSTGIILVGYTEQQPALDQFDQARRYMELARRLSFLLYLVPLLLLAAIGFLGGRRWRSRLAWAAVPLLLAAGIAYVASGPVYRAVAEPIVNRGFADAARGQTGVAQLMIQQGTSVAQTVINDFVSGLATRAMLLLILALVALGVAIFWPLLRKPFAQVRRGEPKGRTEEMPGPSQGPSSM